jgi:hypothetical protein
MLEVMHSPQPLRVTPHLVGSPRFLDCSVGTRCPQPPRRVRRLHTLVASPPMIGFSAPGGLATLNSLTRSKWVHLCYGSRLRRSRLRTNGITPACARLATCQTSNLHGGYLSIHKNNQAYPGAPGMTIWVDWISGRSSYVSTIS